jgi:hypothetical protein
VPASAGVYVGAGSAARGGGSLSGSHHGRQRRTRLEWCFTHWAHGGWAATMMSNRRGVGRESYIDCADGRGVCRISPALPACLPFVLEPKRIVDNLEIIHLV